MNGLPTSQVQVFLEILHQQTTLDDNVVCTECPEQPWPCRTMSLLNVGLRMDRRGLAILSVNYDLE